MKMRATAVLSLAVFGAFAAEIEDLPNVGNVTLDLGGATKTVRNWEWPGWNGFYMSVSNGTLSVVGRMHPRHGTTDILAGGTLRFEDGSSYMPGAGDAQPRTTRILSGGTLDLSHGKLNPFNTRFIIEKGGLVLLGCDLKSVQHGNKWLVRGGRLVVTDHVDFDMNEFLVDTNAVLEVEVADGKVADMSKVVLAPGAQLKTLGKGTVIRSHDDPRWAKCQTMRELDKMDIHARGDMANRCYCIYFSPRATNIVRRVAYKCPEFGVFATKLPYFSMRYPAGTKGSFEIQAVVEAKDGTRVKKTVAVPFNDHPIGKPAPNEDVFLGMVCYGPGRERHEMITNDLANLYARWDAAPQLVDEKANNEISPNWMYEAAKRGIRSMTIYARASSQLRDEIKSQWGARYLGNNCGERTGFLYGAPQEMRGPQDRSLTEARHWFMSSFLRGDWQMSRGGKGEDPFLFATSGAAFANYELPGGVDYVCNELYAVGCQNITFATAENRGAARKWGPEWWSGWLAHEWQTFPLRYDSDDKYLSLEAGIKSLYVMGTSLMCLESGSSGTQAHPYTWGVPDDRRKTGYQYDDDPPRRYRETIRKCHKFIKEHPRAKGTPETKIALALGCNDGYIGCHSTPWAQHTNRLARAGDKINIWGASHPEMTWDRAREVFFPASGTTGVSGAPYGQVDVVGVDDQSRVADLVRYSLVVFGGWNTMTKNAKKVLEDWMAKGGMCIMCLPQCSTRDDRDFLGYGAKDLLLPCGLKVARFESSSGIEVACLSDGSGVEIVRTVTGQPGAAPLVVRKRVGKGAFYLMLSKEFPGARGDLGNVWKGLLAECAEAVPQTIRLEKAVPADELRFFTAAAYADKAYVMNLDMHKTRSVKVHVNGKPSVVELSPLEVREFKTGK